MQLVRKTVCWSVLPVLLAAVVWPAWGQTPGLAADLSLAKGVTRPSARRELSFDVPGVVAAVAVKDGDQVKAGQLLMAERTRQEELALEALRLEADTDLAIRARQADLDVKQVELDRVQSMRAKNVASDKELEEAQLRVKLAELEVDLARLEQQQKKLKVQQQEEKLKQMRLVSPIDGYVEKVVHNVGEVAVPDPEKPSCVIVCNDPLWVEVHLPQSQAQMLKLGQSLPVGYTGEHTPPVMAKVIYFAPEAEYGGRSQMVRLEMPNPAGRWSGADVYVQLPAATAQGR